MRVSWAAFTRLSHTSGRQTPPAPPPGSGLAGCLTSVTAPPMLMRRQEPRFTRFQGGRSAYPAASRSAFLAASGAAGAGSATGGTGAGGASGSAATPSATARRAGRGRRRAGTTRGPVLRPARERGARAVGILRLCYVRVLFCPKLCG